MNFTNKYKNYSNSQLLQIIGNSEDYQPDAVETAKQILEERHLSAEDFQKAKTEIESDREKQLMVELKKRERWDNVKNMGKSFFSNINPIQKEKPGESKTINIISALIGVFYLYYLFSDFEMIRYMLYEGIANWDFSMVLYFFPIIIVPVATILFFMRKKTGWILMTIYLVFSAVSVIVMMIMLAITLIKFNMFTDDVLPNYFPLYHVFFLLMFVGLIWRISSTKIRTKYNISAKVMIITIILSAIVTVIVLRYIVLLA